MRPNPTLEPTATDLLFAAALGDSQLLAFVGPQSPAAPAQFDVRREDTMKIAHLVVLAMIVPLPGVCRDTSVDIVKLEQSYRIMICTEGRYWLPISPEGPFPKWSDSSDDKSSWPLVQRRGS